MAKLEFELKDSNGIDVNIGDEIIVTIPEVEIRQGGDGDYEYYRPQITARAKIYLPPSNGLMIKILEVIDVLDIDNDVKNKDCYNDSYTVGKALKFPRTTWHWSLHKESPAKREYALKLTEGELSALKWTFKYRLDMIREEEDDFLGDRESDDYKKFEKIRLALCSIDDKLDDMGIDRFSI